jgi:hypothetical protein
VIQGYHGNMNQATLRACKSCGYESDPAIAPHWCPCCGRNVEGTATVIRVVPKSVSDYFKIEWQPDATARRIEQIEAAYYVKVELILRLQNLAAGLVAIHDGAFDEAHVALYVGGWTRTEPPELEPDSFADPWENDPLFSSRTTTERDRK